MIDKFYTVNEVAELLKVKPRTIRSLIKEKKLRALNVGIGRRIKGNWRILSTELDRFKSEEYLNFSDFEV